MQAPFARNRAPQVFSFESSNVRTLDLDGEIWFVASDIADALGYRDAPNLVRNLDEDEKGTQAVSTPGGRQSVTVISESGLYSAILSSRKPDAKKFRRWVTHEVLPAIRKTGQYVSPFLQLKLTDQQQALLRKWLSIEDFKVPHWDVDQRRYDTQKVHIRQDITYDKLHRRVILLARAVFQKQKDRTTFEQELALQLSLAVRDAETKAEALIWFNRVLSGFEREAIAHIVKGQNTAIAAEAPHPSLS